MLKYLQYCLLVTLFASGCGDSSVPLDADARRMVDSLSAVQIGIERRSIDSLCKVQQATVLPQLIDSIKKARLQQIERQLKSIPK